MLISGEDGQDFVYLIDFGIARTTLGPDITRTGVAVGTVAYMAPERFLSRASEDHRIDVYALGCLLYELLTAETPFTGDIPAQMYAHLSTPAPRPSERRPELPPGLNDVIVRAMATNRDDRYKRAGELAAAARAALAVHAVPAAMTVPAGLDGGGPAPVEPHGLTMPVGAPPEIVQPKELRRSDASSRPP